MLAVVAALGLAGCSGLAGSSPVRPGLAVDADVQAPLDYVPPLPFAGADPAAILRGFILAGAASDGNYEVGRAYLTQEAGKSWSPDGSVVVFSTDVPVKITSLGANQYRVDAVATTVISADGRFENLPANTHRTFDVSVAKVNGQWRIANLPQNFGRWIRSLDLIRLFVAYNVNYLSKLDGSLIPDRRWFPRDHLATRLASAQLGPVPDYLEGAVKTSLPADAALTVASVPVTDGVATVDLTADTFTSDVNIRRGIWAQFAATLTQLTQVSKVQILNEGAPLDFPGRPDAGVSASDLGLATTWRSLTVAPIVRAGKKVKALTRDQLAAAGIAVPPRLPELSYNDVDTGFTSLALSADGSEVAVVEGDDGGLSRWRAGTLFQVELPAKQLSQPAYDSRGFLWVGAVGTAHPQTEAMWQVDTAATAAGARAVAIAADWLAGRRVLALEVAPDGMRVAVVSTDAQGAAHVDVSGVARNNAGAPVSLSQPLPLATTLSQIRDVTWVDPTTVAVIGRTGATGTITPYLVALDGRLTSLPVTPGADRITALTGERDLVITAGEEIRIRSGPSWDLLATGTDFAVAGG